MMADEAAEADEDDYDSEEEADSLRADAEADSDSLESWDTLSTPDTKEKPAPVVEVGYFNNSINHT